MKSMFEVLVEDITEFERLRHVDITALTMNREDVLTLVSETKINHTTIGKYPMEIMGIPVLYSKINKKILVAYDVQGIKDTKVFSYV